MRQREPLPKPAHHNTVTTLPLSQHNHCHNTTTVTTLHPTTLHPTTLQLSHCNRRTAALQQCGHHLCATTTGRITGCQELGCTHTGCMSRPTAVLLVQGHHHRIPRETTDQIEKTLKAKFLAHTALTPAIPLAAITRLHFSSNSSSTSISTHTSTRYQRTLPAHAISTGCRHWLSALAISTGHHFFVQVSLGTL